MSEIEGPRKAVRILAVTHYERDRGLMPESVDVQDLYEDGYVELTADFLSEYATALTDKGRAFVANIFAAGEKGAENGE